MKRINKIVIILVTMFSILFSGLNQADAQERFRPPEDAYEGLFWFSYGAIMKAFMAGMIYKDSIYVPLKDLFSRMLIFYDFDNENQIMKGYFIDRSRTFELNFLEHKGKFEKKEIDFKEDDFILTDYDVFLLPRVYKEIFNLDVKTNFQDLTISISMREYGSMNDNLPIMKKLLREQQYTSLGKIFNENVDYYDLLYDREPRLFDGGMLDYNLSSSIADLNKSYSYGTNFGIQLLGGDLIAYTNGTYNNSKFNYDLRYKWRYWFGSNPYLTQVSLGYISNTGYSTNVLPMEQVLGIQLSNEETIRPQHFTDMVFEGVLEPGWTVELYENGHLIDYKITEADGSYRFDLPLNYGNSNITRKIYGTKGELLEESDVVRVPSELLQPGDIKYSLTGGRSMYGTSKVGDGKIGIGLTNWMSNFTGVKYTDFDKLSVYNRTYFRIFSTLTANVDVSPLDFYRATLESQNGNMGSYTLNFTQYDPKSRMSSGGTLLNTSELIATFPEISSSFPLTVGFRASRRHFINQGDYFINSFARFYVGPISLNVRHNLNLWEKPDWTLRRNYITPQISYTWSGKPDAIDFLGSTRFVFGADYDLLNKYLDRVRGEFSQRFFNRIIFSLSYTKDYRYKNEYYKATLSWILPWVRSVSDVVHTKDYTTYMQRFSGTVGYDSDEGDLFATSQNFGFSVGSGAANLKFFLDENLNGSYDQGEKTIPAVKVRVPNGSTNFSWNRETGDNEAIGMIAYGRFNVVVDKESFINPLWVPEHERFSFISDPNTFKGMYIPCYSTGVVEGIVVKVTDGEKEPQPSVKVHIEKKDGSYKQVIPVFADGTFYHVGVPPGEYVAWVDSAQCEILNVEQQPTQLAFSVNKTVDGDFVEGLELELFSQEAHLAKANGKKKMATDIATEEELLRHSKEEAEASKEKEVASKVITSDKTEETFADLPKETKSSFPDNITINENKLFSYSGVRDIKLTKEMQQYLDKISEYLKKNMRAVVSIVGHTDNFGTFEETQNISEQRSQEAAKYLVGKGVSKERILARGEGARTPIVSNTTPSGRKQNRRLEVTIIE